MTTQQPRDDEHGLDEALRRVAAADPAADAELDTTRLHATLAATTGVRVDADELAAARARRSRTRWLQAAAAVAAVAVVGAGGYAVGATGGPAAASPAITLDQPERDSVAGSGQAPLSDVQEDAAVSGTTQVRQTSGAAEKFALTLPATSYAGHLVFHAKDLSDEGATHAAWAYDAASAYSRDTVELLADVFGVTGAVRQDYGWTVGPVDGSRATVTLSPDGMATASYYDPTRDPWTCSEERSAPDEPQVDGQAEHAGGGTSGGAAGDDKASTWGTDVEPLDPGRIVPMTPDCGQGEVSSKQARSQAQDTLEALGLEPDDYEYEVTATGGAAASVIAYGVVDGQRTGAMWSFTVAEDGVQSASGPMAPLVALGDYDVVSPSEAVARLNDPRFAETYGVFPLMARAEAADAVSAATVPLAGDAAVSAPADQPADEPTVPATLEPGADLPWLVTDVMVTDARLGVALRTFDDGSTALVPAYQLSDGAGGSWNVIAVTDAQLSFAG
ncbi:hypothetical protein KIN34_02920 [Cellulomonas sp. DKR-3]|uniref:Uncharacterized protein n=1 Tax=Cellulomonas fulva TaxID=2835530 RepID=A0ABS5TVR3_9CELL|nr:hypothetical protein [Cellulomonas fulva]MBT0993242.1 hypothetical protein [Cellulomonas fulva]